MQSHFYLDLVLQPPVDEASGNAYGTAYALRNRVYGIVHGALRQRPQQFALALPARTDRCLRLRVFAAHTGDLDWLKQAISAHPVIRDYVLLQPVKPVGEVARWLSYRRYRIPTVKSDRHAVDGNSELRKRRLAASSDMDRLVLSSQSTNQRFTLAIQTVAATEAGDGLPDGYGLARASSPFAVPDLP